MPARVIAIGEPQNEAERHAIATLRDALPDGYTLYHNLELGRGGRRYEIDIAVVAPHAVYLVDVKGTRGTVLARGGEWHPEGRAPFPSPLGKLRAHARSFKGALVDGPPAMPALHKLYVGSVVVLSDPSAVLHDPTGADAQETVSLAKAAAYFRDATRVPPGFTVATAPYFKRIEAALGAARPPTRRRVREWEIDERLGGNDRYTEYRAHHADLGADAASVRLRLYALDPYVDEARRRADQAFAANAYAALQALPPHPALLAPRAFFVDDDASAAFLVYDDVNAEGLGALIAKADTRLTPHRRIQIAEAVLDALHHLSSQGVVHRAVTPATVLVPEEDEPGRLAAFLSGFDVARPGVGPRDMSVADVADDRADERYGAPEVYENATAATPASDVFSAGAVIYELFAGKPPYERAETIFDAEARFAEPVSQWGTLPDGVDPKAFDLWLQSLCAFIPGQRPTAGLALSGLRELLAPPPEPVPPPIDYTRLPVGYALTSHMRVEEPLGQGGFATAYRVFDAFSDRSAVVKIVTHDRDSTYGRMLHEYRALLDLPEHPHVVRPRYAEQFADGTPYLVMAYVEGTDVSGLIRRRALTPPDAWRMAEGAAEGLVHLHRHGIFHSDIKPSNILWTAQGARLIDFNVVTTAATPSHGGGSLRYVPPDYDTSAPPTAAVRADRDVYALGLTLFEAVTGRFPYDPSPVPGAEPVDPRSIAGSTDLSVEAASLLLKAVAPQRGRRFESADAFLRALREVRVFRRTSASTSVADLRMPVVAGGNADDGTNPFVSYLRTLYSQSRRTNAGTRGLDERNEGLYVDTALDRELMPAVLDGATSPPGSPHPFPGMRDGALRLVVITGNAGDGKTAFLQRLEREAVRRGAVRTARPDGNGATLAVGGWTLRTNYDGSQDEGDTSNADVLRDFFRPFEGDAPEGWTAPLTHLIAINEGRLVDFLETERARYGALAPLLSAGLEGNTVQQGIAVVNLNLRSVTAAPDGEAGDRSIFRRLLNRFTRPERWAACAGCPLADRCYAHHNARTFSDPVVGPIVAERLETLYRLTTLRNRLHITLRDLGSALAFTLTSDRDCTEIQALYDHGDAEAILDSFYFNAYQGGTAGSTDRLLALLREADVGAGTSPRVDRSLGFTEPESDDRLLTVEGRGHYDRILLQAQFAQLRRGYAGRLGEPARVRAHRSFVAARRRLTYFEQRADTWKAMLPFEASDRMLDFLQGRLPLEVAKGSILGAINRAEGLADPELLGDALALQLREVRGGTIRSLRVFPGDRFTIHRLPRRQAAYVETEPTGLLLAYEGARADLPIDLDLFELLDRLNRGYRPSPDDLQGRYLSLVVFKNLLGALPYDELLLTPDGVTFHRIRREEDGRLSLRTADDLTPS